MPPSPITFLLLRHNHRHLSRHVAPLTRHFSLSSTTPPPPDPPNPTSSLSSRLSFVFEKIDQIERDRSEKDQALQRIRSWRQTNQPQPPPQQTPPPPPGDGVVEVEVGVSGGGKEGGREIEVAHPWPEWVELMERLLKQNYFDHRRKDEDEMIEGLGEVDVGKFEDGGVEFDLSRDWRTVNNAMVSFGKDRFDIFRSLSRQDIQLLVGYGCPSVDKKVVFSSKLLRKHVHLDEGDVCSSCSLRNTCERAYLVTNKEDEARTIDLMRVLLTYGFDPINGSVENKSLLKQKSVKTAVRKLLHEVVRLSAVPIDPNLPPPVIKKRPPKVKQPPPPPKRRVGRDDIEMKKGDWLCQKCNFMNFAKNSVCLQCDAKRPKRQLLPGEWECPECDFLNYRRNMTCFNCEHKRPPDAYMENQSQERQNRPITRLERVPDREQVSNAWNFDFDDDESDGADVAAFEYADPHAMNEDRHLDSPPDGNFGRPQKEYRAGQTSRFQEPEQSRPAQIKHGAGFDDFDDEDDDIDSYELDNQNRKQREETSSVRFSDVESEGYSESNSDDDLAGGSGRNSSSYPKSTKPLYQRAVSQSEDDDLDLDLDEDLPVHPKWKSSHVADSGPRGRALRGPSKRRILGSDDDDKLVFGSDDDVEEGLTHRQQRGNYRDSDRTGHRRGDSFKEGFESRQGRGSYRDFGERGFSRGDESNRNRRQSESRGRQDVNSVKGNDFDSDFGRSSRGSHGNLRGASQRGSFNNDRGHQRMSGSQRGARNFNEPRQGGAGNGGHRRVNKSDNWSDMEDRPLRQRRNVR